MVPLGVTPAADGARAVEPGGVTGSACGRALADRGSVAVPRTGGRAPARRPPPPADPARQANPPRPPAPPNQAPPNQAPPNQAPPNQAPPAQAPPIEAPSILAPATRAGPHLPRARPAARGPAA